MRRYKIAYIVFVVVGLLLSGCVDKEGDDELDLQIKPYILKSPGSIIMIDGLIDMPTGGENAAEYYNRIIQRVEGDRRLVDTLANGMPYISLQDEAIRTNFWDAVEQEECKFHPDYFPCYTLKNSDEYKDKWLLLSYLVNGLVESAKMDDDKYLEYLEGIVIFGNHFFEERAHIVELMTGISTMLRGSELIKDYYYDAGDSSEAAKFQAFSDSLNKVIDLYSAKIKFMRDKLSLTRWLEGDVDTKVAQIKTMEYFFDNNKDRSFTAELINTLILLKHFNDEPRVESELDRVIAKLKAKDDSMLTSIIDGSLNISETRKGVLLNKLRQLESQIKAEKQQVE